jgi:hypothetical protein
MLTQMVAHVDPEFPGGYSPGQSMAISFNVVIGTDGHVKQMTALNGDEPYISAAKNALQRWTFKPQMWNGAPVAVATTLGVWFNSGSRSSGSPLTVVDACGSSPFSIILKSGSTIHADTVVKNGDNVSYTIDWQDYEIPNSLVERIVSRDAAVPAAPAASSAAAANKAIPADQDPSFPSLAELRRECESHTFRTRESRRRLPLSSNQHESLLRDRG